MNNVISQIPDDIDIIKPTATLIDIVYPGDTNPHGTLFGGEGLAMMDKAAFIAAARFGRATFVTASCERVDFVKPAYVGEIVEFKARNIRAGRRSLTVVIDMTSETIDGHEKRLCTRGIYHMVAVPEKGVENFHLPELKIEHEVENKDVLKVSEIVFANQTNQYGQMFGGEALSFLTNAAFIMASRFTGKTTTLACSERVDFKSPVAQGSIIDAIVKIVKVGNTSLTLETELWSEVSLTGERKHTATAQFVMVAVDKDGRPTPIKD